MVSSRSSCKLSLSHPCLRSSLVDSFRHVGSSALPYDAAHTCTLQTAQIKCRKEQITKTTLSGYIASLRRRQQHRRIHRRITRLQVCPVARISAFHRASGVYSIPIAFCHVHKPRFSDNKSRRRDAHQSASAPATAPLDSSRGHVAPGSDHASLTPRLEFGNVASGLGTGSGTVYNR